MKEFENHLVAGGRAVVEHLFAWIKNVGYKRTCYRGLSCNGFDLGLYAIVYNWKMSFSLLKAVPIVKRFKIVTAQGLEVVCRKWSFLAVNWGGK